jgi:hypothetical protein
VAVTLTILAEAQPIMVDHEGLKATMHMALNDATNDSAFISYKCRARWSPIIAVSTGSSPRPAL